MSLYFFVLGLGLGLILQVLVIAVQNSADYADLGTATSGVTFFRYHRRLVRRGHLRGGLLQPAGHRTGRGAARACGCRRGSTRRPPRPTRRVLQTLPAALRGRHPARVRAVASTTVFLAAVPVAAGRVRAHLVPARGAAAQATAAAPPTSARAWAAASAQRSSAEELERALLRLADVDLRQRGYARLAEACRARPARGQLLGAGPAGQARRPPGRRRAGPQAGVTMEHGRPYVDKLVDAGYVSATTASLALTPAGQRGRGPAVRRGPGAAWSGCWPTGPRSSTPTWPRCSTSCPARCSARPPTSTSSTGNSRPSTRSGSIGRSAIVR